MSDRKSLFSRAARAGRTALLLCAAIGVPLFFVNSTWIAARLERLLRLEVEPSFIGGRVLAEFPDPMGDDDGPGGYAYPLGQGRERGELDLVDYIVRRPVSRPIWGDSGAFWQLDAYFAKAVATGLPGGGFRAPVLHVYVQVQAAKPGAAGSTETAFGEGELLRFDPAHPWDYVISADGWSAQAEIRSADGAYRAPVLAIWDIGQRRLSLRIGLEKAPPLLTSVMKGGSTWHYVLVGAYDAARDGHFAKEPTSTMAAGPRTSWLRASSTFSLPPGHARHRSSRRRTLLRASSPSSSPWRREAQLRKPTIRNYAAASKPRRRRKGWPPKPTASIDGPRSRLLPPPTLPASANCSISASRIAASRRL